MKINNLFILSLSILLLTTCGVQKKANVLNDKAITKYDVKNLRTSIDEKFPRL